ncbi:HvfC/BufC N-terminal domain-containing protein [Paraburkholderia atlantica]|uniref:Putative DNA-binding domain-containing protein n=1 Tax=Paraburkholderia atlantica TaxID=2654982 RepID=D5WNN6_PARAM|nr:DNA-binding domain-containing protein [Paraburkholderia atlantica]ADG20915.1 Protein of unknown function DUF2063 [Paraburkholderia atlantica]MBB5510943.1 hypothetical protein [Paraburkholderia atlantica]
MTQPLELTQQRFADALLDAACEPALSDAVAASATPAPLHHRIALYRGNLWAHGRGALANAYPVLLELVGDDYFDALARAYDRAHPSQSGDLNRFGRTLPEFIECYEADARFRYFGDLARLEWALHGAHFAADATPFTQEQWSAFGHDRLLDARIGVHPACVALTSRFAVAQIWHAHQPGGTFPAQIDSACCALVVRPRWRAYVIQQPAAAHAAFVALQRGDTLNHALDAAFTIDPAFDFASQWHHWFASGAVVGAFKR